MTKKIYEIVWFLSESAIILENWNFHAKALNKSENYLRLPFFNSTTSNLIIEGQKSNRNLKLLTIWKLKRIEKRGVLGGTF